MRRRGPTVVAGRALVPVLAFVLTGCLAGPDTGPDGGPDGGPEAGSNGGPDGTVTVLAAASLTEAFSALGESFEQQRPGMTVRFSFAASSQLAAQISQGAPADVFASASPATMAQVVDAGEVAGPVTVFARNRLEIAVPAGNPAGVTGLTDFARSGLVIALCAEEVPCGQAATAVFDAAGVVPRPDTLEEDVKAALTKVRLGEVDAALVYRTDVLAAGDAVEGIDFPESRRAVNDYPIAVLARAPRPAAARAWVDLVRSDRGAEILRDFGFVVP